MQISPRYEGPPILRFDIPVGDPAVPLLRQRRRLANVLGSLDDDQWAEPSRCDGWSVQDVVAHLISTNQYWAISLSAGFNGEPTRFLASFDPVATPAQLIEPMRALSPADVLQQFTDTVEAMADVVTGLDEATWRMLAEAPPGHITANAVAMHTLWDSWIHERDIVLPLELEHTVEPDEVTDCLHYVAAIGPGFTAATGSTREGVLTIVGTDPDISFVVRTGSSIEIEPGTADGPRLTGDAVALVESLSFRVPIDYGLADDDLWLLGGLGTVFDKTNV